MRRLLLLAAATTALVGAAAPPVSAEEAAPRYCVPVGGIGGACVVGNRCVVEGGGTMWNLCLIPRP